jgi:DNA-binding transcriptional MerR regulator
LFRTELGSTTQTAQKTDVIADLDSITVICENTVMIDTPNSELTLDDLSQEVDRLLAQQGLVQLQLQPDHRVSTTPDGRTIRYYTTLGLLDRPAIQGRQAKYGRRHVLQLLAIKALQATSLPLADVQSRLYGLSDSELEAIINSVASSIARKPEQIQRLTKPSYWKEIVIEPGLKLVAEEGWSSSLDQASLEEKIRAALVSLQIDTRQANGG